MGESVKIDPKVPYTGYWACEHFPKITYSNILPMPSQNPLYYSLDLCQKQLKKHYFQTQKLL